MALVFVYGSLKEGFCNAHLNAGVRRPGAYRTSEVLPMYLLGDGHVPCLVLAPGVGYQVCGELYEIDNACLDVMDRLERLGESDGYLRVVIDVETIDAPRREVLTSLVYAKSPGQVAAEQQRVGPLAEYTAEHATRFRW